MPFPGSEKTIVIPPAKSQLRSLIIDRNQEALIVEVIDSESDLSQKLTTEIIIKNHARVRHIFFLHENLQKNFLESRTVELRDGAELTSFYCYFGGLENAIRLHYKIQKGARVVHKNIFFARGQQKFSFDEKYEFQKEGSFGRFIIKGITIEKATSNTQGNIHINPRAHHTDSRLEMESIILGKDARSGMVPSLEIHANDVKAGHSAKITQMNEDQMFYLQSRGLKKEEAIQLFLDGMFTQFVKEMDYEPLASKILKMVKTIH